MPTDLPGRIDRRRMDFGHGPSWKLWAKAVAIAVFSWSMTIGSGVAGERHDAVTTIVFIRHGEKPQDGLGQLDCQGLNRALALPAIIASSFGRPNVIFAPNPSDAKEDDGKRYDYIRPLATIEPTAIWFGLPVDVSIPFLDREGLQAAIEKYYSPDRNMFILVAWEHKQIPPVVRALLTAHGADAEVVKKVEDWGYQDFDSMYVVTIAGTKASFAQRHEGLDGQPETCPH